MVDSSTTSLTLLAIIQVFSSNGAYLFNQGHMSDHESLKGSASFTLNLYELIILCLRHFDL